MTVGGLLRTGARAVFGSSGAAVDELTAADTAIRSVMPISRRVGFVSMSGGCGTTSAMTAVARLLTARRPGPILTVDAAGGWAGVGRRLAVDPASAGGTEEDREQRRTAQTLAEARSGLAEVGPGLHFLDLVGPGDSRRPAVAVSHWAEQLGPIARFFDLVLTDWGVRPAADDLDQVAFSGQVLAVVSRADRLAATSAAEAVAALQTTEQPPRLLLVLTDVGRTPDRIAGGLQSELGVPVLWLPYDAAHGTGWSLPSRRFSAAGRRAGVALAAALMREAVISQAPGRLTLTDRAAGPSPVVPQVVQPR